MATAMTQNNAAVSLYLILLALSALCNTTYSAPMCAWSTNYKPIPTMLAFNVTSLSLISVKLASLHSALSQNGLTCLIDMQLNAEEREALKRPYHRCYGQERTENEINNFAIKQRLEADGLILWNTVILLKYAMRYDNSHTTVLSGYIRSAKTQIAEIYSALENMIDTIAPGVNGNMLTDNGCILSEEAEDPPTLESYNSSTQPYMGRCKGLIAGYDDVYRIVYEAQMVLELVYHDLDCIIKSSNKWYIPDIVCNCGSHV